MSYEIRILGRTEPASHFFMASLRAQLLSQQHRAVADVHNAQGVLLMRYDCGEWVDLGDLL